MNFQNVSPRAIARGLCSFCFTFNVPLNGTITEAWYYWLEEYVLYIVLCLYCMLYMLLSHHVGLRAMYYTWHWFLLRSTATCYNQITLAWGMRSVLPLLSELTLARLLITFSPGKDDDDGDRIGNFRDCLIPINRVLESWNYFPKYEINIYSSSAKNILESSCAIRLLEKKKLCNLSLEKALSRHDGSWEF